MASLRAAVQKDGGRNALIAGARFGFDGKVPTLEQLGMSMGMTRERVRQVVQIFAVRVAEVQGWHDRTKGALGAMLDGADAPLTLAEVERRDSWFAGASSQPAGFQAILSALFGSAFHVISVNGQDCLSRVTTGAWKAALARAGKIVAKAAEQECTEDWLRERVDACTPEAAPELGVAVWQAVQDRVVVSAGIVVGGRGETIDAAVNAVLHESTRPLHYKEIMRRTEARLGRRVGRAAAHPIAKNGILLGKGRYGCRRHLRIASTQAMGVRAACAESVAADADRQWHVSELLRRIRLDHPDLAEGVNQYVLNAVLLDEPSLAYLGRFVWAARGSEADSPDRLQIHDLVRDALAEAGRPLRVAEIRSRVASRRGVSHRFFQVMQKGDVVSVGKGLWGLASWPEADKDSQPSA